VVRRDIDESRLKLGQLVDVGKQTGSAGALQWRQYLERELTLAVLLVDDL
jgi:hypothetical protein